MNRRIVLLLLTLSILLLPVRAEGVTEEDPVEQILSQMSTREKLAQMIMPTFRGDPGRTDGVGEAVEQCLREYGFAGAALFAEELETAAQAVRRTDAMQTANAAAGRPQLLLAVDQEGGMVTRLGQGTMTCGNMALGAVNDTEATGQIAAILGGEILACGLNVDFAPVLDVNSNPANPVIGIRSFSDDPEIAAAQGEAFLRSMQGTGAVACLKHFPGHGDTDTDSHTGLPRVEKNKDELLRTDLVPFARCIEAGAEMIMTSHIQFPAIETDTHPSEATGEPVILPATLSDAIITDLLRGELGFGGVVITDALGMDAIRKHFTAEDSARLAIEAGVDILLSPPVQTSELGGFIDRLSELADAGEISMRKVDAAVERILRLKQRHGLLEPYDTGRLDERLEAVEATVGSAEHHETEWEIAKRAVTLVKNEGVLPYPDLRERTVVLTAYDSELQAMAYALGRLRDEQLLPRGADVEILSMQDVSGGTLAEWIDGASHVIAVSELTDSARLYGGAAERLDSLIAAAHENGADVTIVSACLPYDCARYPDADAIALCWLNRAMSEDPREADRGVAQYGPNLPAALYLLLSGQSPKGRLSVDIPALRDGGFSDEVLYPRGTGLRYAGAEDPVEEEDDISDDFGDDVEEYTEYRGDIADYKDVNGRAWYYADVKRAVNAGWMTGSFGPWFSPGAYVTGKDAVDALSRFAGAAGPIAWARDRGLLTGLHADETVTRRQLAALLARYAGEENAADSIAWAQTQPLFRPRADGHPDGPVTRAVLAHALCVLRDAGF